MKKLIAILTAVMILAASAAMADNLTELSDDELIALWHEVQAEMENRGITDREAAASDTEVKAALLQRVTGFFRQWAENSQDGMLEYCSSDWKESVENPRNALFGLLTNRTPRSMETISVSGGPGDNVRTVTVHSLIDRNNGLAPGKYRLDILVKLEEDGQWYIDPRSLSSSELTETETPVPGTTETPAGAADDTVLYYQPDGGTYYHADRNCKRVNSRYLPLEGHFLYSEVNDEPYSSLKPCAVCGAPLRRR